MTAGSCRPVLAAAPPGTPDAFSEQRRLRAHTNQPGRSLPSRHAPQTLFPPGAAGAVPPLLVPPGAPCAPITCSAARLGVPPAERPPPAACQSPCHRPRRQRWAGSRAGAVVAGRGQPPLAAPPAGAGPAVSAPWAGGAARPRAAGRTLCRRSRLGPCAGCACGCLAPAAAALCAVVRAGSAAPIMVSHGVAGGRAGGVALVGTGRAVRGGAGYPGCLPSAVCTAGPAAGSAAASAIAAGAAAGRPTGGG